MKEYVLSIIVSVLLVSVASIILPEGKMAKFTKSIFSLIIIIIIITPALKLLKDPVEFNKFDVESDSTFSEDVDFLEYVYYKKIENLSTATENTLKNKNYDADVEIIYEISDYQIIIKKVNVILQSTVISDDDKHIIISVIKETVANRLDIDKEIIIVK